MGCSHLSYDLQPLWTLTVLLIISWVVQLCGLMSLEWYAAHIPRFNKTIMNHCIQRPKAQGSHEFDPCLSVCRSCNTHEVRRTLQGPFLGS